MHARITFLHALSLLHAGTGQGAGVIDLPIAREKATGLPFLPGSSLKGSIRASYDMHDPEQARECRKVFGPDVADMNEDGYASSVQFSDQRLLLLPVRSLAGTFAWVTSPYVLLRLARDSEDAEATLPTAPVPTVQDEENYIVIGTTSKILVDAEVYLEDLELKHGQPDDSPAANSWASWIAERVFPDDTSWQTTLRERFCIIHDDVFSFLLDTATEITARIKLKPEAKIVEDGGLWYEEALPTETILSGIVLVAPTKAADIRPDRVFEILENRTQKTLQFGGKATVGRGLCRVRLAANSGETGRGA